MLDIPAILTQLAQRHTKTFMYQSQPLALERAFAFDGGLPIFVKRANLLADFLFGHKLEVALVNDPNAMTSERVSIMPEQSIFVLMMLLYDVLEEYMITTPGNEINLV